MKPGACRTFGDGGSSSRSTRTTMMESCNNATQHRRQYEINIGKNVFDVGK
jgi:hypothetical protein